VTELEKSKTTLSPAAAARVALWTGVAVSGILYLVPFGQQICYPLVLVSTVAHELGHGITALFLGGSPEQIVVYRSAAGVTNYTIEPGWRIAVVAAGGLIGPAAVSAISFRCARTPFGARTVAMLCALILIWVVLFIGASDPRATSMLDRWFAPLFMSLLAAGLIGLAWRGNETFCQFAVIFIAVQLALSVFTRSDYLFTQSVNGRPGSASDVEQIARHLFLPYWFWGIVCAGLSLAILAFGLKPYWRKKEPGRSSVASSA